MKKLGILLLVVFLVGVGAGCVGEKTTTTSTTSTPSTTSSTLSSTTSKVSAQPKHYSRDELLKNLRSIRQFTYIENTSISFNLTVKQGNLTQSGKVTVVYRRKGYIDFEEKKAEVNTTTITFPGGASSFTREIIVGNEVYIFFGGGWLKLTNETLGISPNVTLNMTWEYNIVNFTEKYLQREPFKETFENGTQILYYNVTEDDLRAISEPLIGKEANVTFNVTNGVLELLFRDGKLIGGRMAYKMSVHIWGEELGKRVDVYEIGETYDEFVVKDINVKKPVHVPASYRA